MFFSIYERGGSARRVVFPQHLSMYNFLESSRFARSFIKDATLRRAALCTFFFSRKDKVETPAVAERSIIKSHPPAIKLCSKARESTMRTNGAFVVLRGAYHWTSNKMRGERPCWEPNDLLRSSESGGSPYKVASPRQSSDSFFFSSQKKRLIRYLCGGRRWNG